jgi:hypothetical protein
MAKLFMALILIAGLSVQAQISFPIGGTTSQNIECNGKIQGGVDVFPWSSAQPFPWADIKGIWKLKDGAVPYYMKAKVVRTTSKRKILNLSIISEANCTKPLAQGVGYIDSSEKNVVRAIINDGNSKYQLKIALFNAKDLDMDFYGCDDGVVMAASLQVISSYPPFNHGQLLIDEENSKAENILLKKVSDDLNSICKKSGTH